VTTSGEIGEEASPVATDTVPGATDTSNDIVVTRDGPIMTILFNRPQRRNAMTWAMYERLGEACDEVDNDDSIRVLVLRGAGGKSFVAGTDISQFTAFETKEDGLEYERQSEKRGGRVEKVKKPVLACIEGFAVGGGFAMAAACDIRICTPDSQFGLPIARTLGNCLNIGAYSRLVDLMGPSRAKEMIFMARLLSADEAKGIGFVSEIVEPDKIEARAYEMAATIASHAPLTIYATKEMIRRVQEQRRGQGGEDLIELVYGSEDFREGVRAFLEKRKPNWKNR
jgi:enoyl-CoA hydratase/carnithine racemase